MQEDPVEPKQDAPPPPAGPTKPKVAHKRYDDAYWGPLAGNPTKLLVENMYRASGFTTLMLAQWLQVRGVEGR